MIKGYSPARLEMSTKPVTNKTFLEISTWINHHWHLMKYLPTSTSQRSFWMPPNRVAVIVLELFTLSEICVNAKICSLTQKLTILWENGIFCQNTLMKGFRPLCAVDTILWEYIYDENPSLATVSFMYITKFLVFGEHMSCYKMTF